ncbi:hypothetical protein CMALT394_20135 [Carnobacterium maltaromaticum]|nr:hypothetical protein CMALT394_20135 [Carnobacterium maltaromaticum]
MNYILYLQLFFVLLLNPIPQLFLDTHRQTFINHNYSFNNINIKIFNIF